MMIEGRLPTVPEYYREFINKDVDLVAEPKQCCPFHSENTPSFSYNIETGRWSCFGKCHAHGGVIEMHMRKFHFASKKEAETDLDARYKVVKHSERRLRKQMAYTDEERIEDNVTYCEAVSLANCPERWLELDYVMSIVPFDRIRLLDLICKWKQ